jgi:hypothetical protein
VLLVSAGACCREAGGAAVVARRRYRNRARPSRARRAGDEAIPAGRRPSPPGAAVFATWKGFSLAAGCLQHTYIESVSAARAFAAKHGYAWPAAGLLGIGAAGCPPRSGTAIRWRAGCRNRP